MQSHFIISSDFFGVMCTHITEAL